MKDKKHIDRLFQEKFKNFEVTPDDANWEAISNRLHKKKRKRRVVPLWWQLGGVAAVLLLLLTVGNFIKDNTNNTSNETIVVNTEDPSINSNKNNSITNSKKEPSTKIVSSTDDTINPNKDSSDDNNSIQKNDAINNSTTNQNNTKSKVANTYNTKKSIINKTSNSLKKDINSVISKTQNDVADNLLNSKESNKKLIKDKSELNSIIKDTKSDINTKVSDVTTGLDSTTKNEKEDNENATEETTDTTKKENTIEEAIAEIEDITEKEEEKQSRWSVLPNVAPVYFNTLGNEGSPIHSQFNNNSNSSDINMSYGITGSYAVNKKLKIRAGINKVALGYNTNNVIVFDGVSRLADPNDSSFSSVNNDSGIQNITFKENNTTFISTSNIRNNVPEALRTLPNSTLEQQFGFIEIPIEAEYTLIDKKLGINVIGGFSTFFLSENEIYASSEGNRTLIGEANNINNISYSANIGLGVNYSVSKKINLNLEPMFKYQINTFNNTSGDFQPYFIGIYTGLSFKF